MKNFAVSFLTRLHFLIFRREMSPTMREFLYHTGWSLFGIFFNAIIFFTISVVAARLLGPAEYGRYNLVIAIAATVTLLMSAGQDVTAIKFIAQFKKPAEKSGALSNALFISLPATLLVVIALGFGRQYLASALHTSGRLILLALAFAVIYTYKNLFDSFLKAYKRFRDQALIKIFEGALILIFFVSFFFITHHRSYTVYVLALGLAAIGAIIAYGVRLLPFFGRWNKKVFQAEKKYWRTFISFSIVGLLLNSLDKFFIARYLGAANLGMYSAYLISSTVVVAQLILALDNVFFPMVNQVEDKRQAFGTLNRFLLAAFVPVVIITAGISYAIILLFGRQYGIQWLSLLLVSLVAFFQIVSSMYNALLASSPELFLVNTRIYYAKPVLVIGLYVLLYHFRLLTIPAVLVVLWLSYVFDAINGLVTIRFFHRDRPNPSAR